MKNKASKLAALCVILWGVVSVAFIVSRQLEGPAPIDMFTYLYVYVFQHPLYVTELVLTVLSALLVSLSLFTGKRFLLIIGCVPMILYAGFSFLVHLLRSGLVGAEFLTYGKWLIPMKLAVLLFWVLLLCAGAVKRQGRIFAWAAFGAGVLFLAILLVSTVALFVLYLMNTVSTAGGYIKSNLLYLPEAILLSLAALLTASACPRKSL